jgi:glycosyltransferase involved in cell wall biosynthesis
MPSETNPMRLAVLCDYPEEGWLSMDLCAQMLLDQMLQENWPRNTREEWHSQRICPQFQHRLTQVPGLGRTAWNGDRLINRFWDYPRHVRQQVATSFDRFHVCDHTYAQLVHELPPERTGVYCHDIDAFRSLLEPAQEPRPRWYRTMAQRILDGLQKAAVVFYSTTIVRQQIEHYQLIESSRLVHAPLGVAPEFTPDAIAPEEAQALFSTLSNRPFLLHVGSCIPRKRMDILLEVFGQLRRHHPTLRLVKVSGTWTPEQQQQIDHLDLRSHIDHWQGLSRGAIAALYRQAKALVLTSEAEGFGLPLLEALACGATAVVSDIPVLREVAGTAALYCPLNNHNHWVHTLHSVLTNGDTAPPHSHRLAQAEKYNWKAHTAAITHAYRQLGA